MYNDERCPPDMATIRGRTVMSAVAQSFSCFLIKKVHQKDGATAYMAGFMPNACQYGAKLNEVISLMSEKKGV